MRYAELNSNLVTAVRSEPYYGSIEVPDFVDCGWVLNGQNWIAPEQTIQDKISEGYLVQPENFILALKDSDRSSFSQMLSLIKEALDLGLITNETPQTIADKNGQKHEISTLRFREIMVQYGFYYKSLWDQMT